MKHLHLDIIKYMYKNQVPQYDCGGTVVLEFLRLIQADMIVSVQHVEQSGAGSIHTLIADERIPRHLVKLVYASLLLSTIVFAFTVADNIVTSRLPKDVVITVLAYVFVLPHHCATILLEWLRRHQTESIFAYTPSHPRAIAYTVVLVALWVASTAMCATSLKRFSGSRQSCFYFYFPDHTIDWGLSNCIGRTPDILSYWTSFASTLTSGLELILVVTITIVCYRQFMRQKSSCPETETPITLNPLESERKVFVLSA